MLWAGARPMARLDSSIRAEAEAFQWVVDEMARFNYNRIIFESDSLTLVKMINGTEEVWPILLPVIETICQPLSQIKEYEVKFFPRRGNKTADRIAKKSIIYVFNIPKLYYVVVKCLIFKVDSDISLYDEQVG